MCIRDSLYPYQDQYDISENNGEFATSRSYKGNWDITWETSYNFNTGVDFAMFNDRVSGTIEGFSRKTVDMLYYKPVPPSICLLYTSVRSQVFKDCPPTDSPVPGQPSEFAVLVP